MQDEGIRLLLWRGYPGMPLVKASHKTLLTGKSPESAEGFPHHLEGKCLTQRDSPAQ